MGINAVLLNFDDSFKRYLRVPGLPPAANLGWVQFAWGSKLGRLHAVNFQQSIVFPEAQGPSGGYLRVPPDLNGVVQTLDEPPGGFSIQTGLGTYNQIKNVLAGLGFPPRLIARDGGTSKYTFVGLPAATAGGAMVSTPLVQDSNVVGQTQNWQKFTWWAIVLDWASQIAQQTCAYNAAETTVSFSSFTGSQLCVPSEGVPRSANIIISSYPGTSSYNFGNYGVPMLGHYAWYYNGSYGPLQCINAENLWAVPESPLVTGIYVMLKPNVVASVDLGVNEYMNTSTQTTVGEVNMAAKIYTGLFPS